MKKALLFATAAALLCGCGSKSRFVVEGDIDGLTGMVYLFEDGKLLDSAAVQDGRFRFTGTADIAAQRTLSDTRTGQPEQFGTTFFLEPGTITVTAISGAPAGSAKVTGTPSNDASHAYRTACDALTEEYRSSATDDDRRRQIADEIDRLTRQTAEANRDNIFGAMLLQEEATHSLSDRGAHGDPTGLLSGTHGTQHPSTQAGEGQSTGIGIGEPYPNIMQGGTDGMIISLSSVVDRPGVKYTLVQFWASWCQPCMDEIPALKRAYDKFHSRGFELFGVSVDNDNDKWLDAIRKKGMNWVHVSDLNGFDNLASTDYGVQRIPANFLIDAKGTIVARDLRGDALHKKLGELLGQ